jgi:hypothetical protein
MTTIWSRRLRVGLVLCALCMEGMALPARAGEPPKQAEYTLKKPEFSITLPGSWAEMPPQAMAQFNANVTRAVPGIKRAFGYGFQVRPKGEWLQDYPYIVVRINTAGRVADSELAGLQKRDLNREFHTEHKEVSTLFTQSHLGQAIYDPTSKVVWITGEMQRKGAAPVRALSEMVLTKTGFVQLSAYAPSDTFAANFAVLRRILSSVTVPAEMRF